MGVVAMTDDLHWPEAGEVACSWCNARVGDPCTTRSGRMAEQTHAMRVDLARIQENVKKRKQVTT
jgi:hypothetical protein